MDIYIRENVFMKKIIICDDDIKFVELFEQQIYKYFTNCNHEVLIERYYSAENLILSGIKTIDIAFLDVEMKDVNGIQLGYEIQKKCPNAVLFIITSYSQYLDEAMDLKVFRYLEKPVDEKRLFRGLDIILQEKQKISFISNNVETEMNEDEIVCIYTSLRKTSVLTDKGETVTSKTTMKEWQKKLSVCNSFSSPHYSYIVNLNYVTGICDDQITVQCKNGKTMKIYGSQRKLGTFRKDFYRKMRENR